LLKEFLAKEDIMAQKVSEEKFIETYNRLVVEGYGYQAKMCKELDLDKGTVSARIKRLIRDGVIALESGNKVGEGEVLKGVSSLYRHDPETGEPKIALQWVKTDVEKEDYLQSLNETLERYTKGLKEVYVPKTIPEFTNEDLTTFYPLPDLHFGLLVNRRESSHGVNFDLKIQTEWVLGAMKHLVDSSPNSKYAVITDLGDFLHAMDDKKQTRSGHHLDVDGRHSKIVDASFAILEQLIEMALEKHERVYFYSVSGNHSEEASIYLRGHINAWFRNENRVRVEMKHISQQYHVFGKNILGFTHGHEMKPNKAGEVMVYDNQDIFSDSEFRYFHFGHFHHDFIKNEGILCNVEIHKNIIPMDKWADSMGYRGIIGDAKAIYYHKKYGEIGRTRFNISMLNDGTLIRKDK
jgi:hypothetical protein